MHPKGVLWFSVMESLNEFQSSEMLAMAHMVTKATAWQEAPVKLCSSPPSSTHLRAYIAGRNACPSGTQSLTPEGEEVPGSPPRNPQPDGRAPCQFHMALGDLGDAQLWQLMEDLWQEVAHRELNVPLRAQPWATGGFQQKMGTPMWMMRMLPSQEGGMGTQRKANLTH